MVTVLCGMVLEKLCWMVTVLLEGIVFDCNFAVVCGSGTDFVGW
jgi:hypothetical protein